MNEPDPVSITQQLEALTFLPDRTPTTSAEASIDAFARIADYRDGAVFIGHWAGSSPWERHPVGDEIVMIIAGATTIIFLDDGEERDAHLDVGSFVVVPEGTWHRFDTAERVKVLTVTPLPTDHSVARPM
jgi:uncharacterized cupin superfamily protein